MSAQFVVSTKVTADASQYTSELTRAGQTTATYTQQVQAADTAAQSMGSGLRTTAAAAQASSAAMAGAQQSTASAAQALTGAINNANKAHAAGTISAAQHAAAMRMLPAQITDVVTSMASGMPVWMVAIQQGGQIKDSFGGAGNAMRAMLGAITPTVAAVGLLAGAAGLATAAYYQGSKEVDGYRQAVVMTGNAAGISVNQLTDMARAMSAISGTQGAAAESLTALAGTGAIASENLQQFATVAIDLERRVGQPIKTTAQHLEELAKAPLQASLKLNEQYHYLTEAVYRQIKALQDQGKQEEAASLAQGTYAGAMAERTAELRSNLGTLERTWEGLGSTARRAWDAMLNIGRAATLSDVRAKIEDTNRQLNDLIAGDGFGSTGGGAATGTGGRGRATQIERLKRQLGELQAQAAPLEAEDAQAQIRAQKQATDAIELAARQRVDALSKSVRSQAEIRRQEIDQLNRDRETLRLSTDAYNKLLAGINEKYKDKKAGGTGKITVTDNELATLQGQLQAARLYHEQLVTLGSGASELNAGERESLKIGEQLARVTDAKTTARLREKQAIADALGVQLRSNDGLEKSLKAHQASIDATFKDADAITQRAAAQEAANATLGKSKTAIEQLTLAELQKQMAEAQATDSFDPKYIAGLELKIAAQQRYVNALGQADYKAAEEHANELLRNAQELGRAYEDEQQLSGLTALEREKITAQRQVELRYAKELAAIDAKALSDAEKQALRDKTLKAKRIETAAAVGKAEQQAQARASEEINRSLTDALMRGFESGKGFAQNLADTTVNLFKTMVLRPTISAIMQPVSLVINGIVQQGLNALGLGSGAAQAVSTAGNAMGLLSLGKNIYQAITGGFASLSGSVATSVQSGLNWLSGSGGMISQGPIQVGGLASGMGTIAGYGAGMMGGVYGGRLISGGYSAFGSSGNSAVNVGTVAGSFFGPIGALVGGLLGGVGNRLFGRKLKDSGIEGDFGGESGFEGRTFKYYKGGLFRSDKTEYSALEEETRKAFADTFTAMKDGTKGMAEVLGLGTEAIDGFTAHIKVSLNGLSAEEADKRLKEEFDKIAETLASTTLGTEEYTREGETAVETLSRLSGSLVGVNAVFENLGYTLYQSSLAGADMASQLVDLFGSLDGFSQATGSFFQNFYSPEEQRAAQRRALEKQFASMGLAMPDIDAADAREQFKALAEAQDQTTEAGRKNWAMLMQLSGAFASVTQSGEDAAAAAAAAAKAEADARKAATDAAWAAMQKSVAAARAAAQAEIDLRQQRLATAQSIVDLTRSQARELRGLVSSTVAITAAQANATIDAALTAARTGQLPDQQGLQEAISAARAGMGTSAYTNRLDYEAAQLILANKLDAIGDSGQAQVDVNQLLLEQAKNEVDRLDMLIKAGQAALDEARGNTVAVRDVETAVKVFYERLFKEKDGNAGTGTGTGASSGSPFVIGGGNSGSSSAPVVDNNRPGAVGENGNYRREIPLYAGLSAWNTVDDQDQAHLERIAALAAQFEGTGDVRGLVEATRAAGGSLSDLATVGGYYLADVNRVAADLGIPAFDVGINRVPYDMDARIHQDELIVPAKFNPFNPGASSPWGASDAGGSTDIVAAISALQSQHYLVGRAILESLKTIETLARKNEAVGVKVRTA